MNKTGIIVYARERYCPDVARTRSRLTELGLTWIEHDIEADEESAAKVEAMTGRRRVPTVVIGDDILVEPLDDELDASLAAAGYAIPAPTQT